MAEIQMVYREGYCDFDCVGTDYNTQCHTQCAADTGCKFFNDGEHLPNHIHFGDCIHANFRTKYKGVTTKKYDIEEMEDPYNPHLNCMLVKIGNRIYQCDKVVLDGECIYNNQEPEDEVIWKDVEGYEGKYRVSNMGEVMSIIKNPHLMTRSLSSSGYLIVTLSNNGAVYHANVHSLVATAFVENKDRKPWVNHIDGNKLNNRADNLEWVTPRENHDHAVKMGLKSSHPTGEPWSFAVLQFDKDGNFIKEWKSKAEAAKYYSCHPDSIRNCIRGRIKTCKGYVWKYKPRK